MDLQGLSSICAGLGAVEESEDGSRAGYSKGAYCLDNLKDLLRFLRRDDPQSREVFKQVCKWNIVSKDLIPIIEHCQDERHLVLNAVKVLVFLTMPIDPMSSDVPLQIEYLWGLKSAVTSSDAVAVVVSLLESPLENLESDAFTEDDWKMMQLILTLFRNLLSVQEISTFQKTSGLALQILSLRDRFLELLFRENVIDIILVVVQHVDHSRFLSEDNVLLLEIFSYIFNGQDPELVAKAHSKGLKDCSAKTSITSLESIIEEENDKRRLSHHRLVGHRHSQFCGTFARFTMDGSKAILKGNPKSEAGNLAIKPGKISRGRNKKIPRDHGTLPSLNDGILKSLHDLLTQFLAGGYNVLMQSIREDIGKEHPNIQAIDVLRFFELAKFAMAFQYQKQSISESIAEANNPVCCSNNIGDDIKFKGEICGPISATMNEPMFLMVISKWRDAFDGLKQTNDYQFLSAAVSLMKAMFRILNLVLKLLPEDSRESQTARILLYKLFYDQTDQGMTQFLLSLMKSFDAHKQPRSDLADLVEIMCTIVRLMERLQDRGALRVSRKSRKGKKKKEDGEKVENTEESSMVGIRNQEDSCDKSTPGNQLLPNDCTPTRTAEGGGLGSLDTDKLQRADISAIKELNAETEVNHPSLEKSDHPDNASDSTSVSSGDEQMIGHSEVDFKLPNLLSTFANSSIIQNLCWLLSFYQSNSTSTNKCIISILRTITDDLGLAPMLYQLSLLTTFYDILAEQKASPQEQYSEIVIFLTRLLRSLLRKMKHQPLLFVDVLFWKTRRECHHINADYLLHEVGNLRRESAYLGEKSSKGEVDTMPSTGWFRRSIADALGDDEADVVLSRDLPSQNNEEEPEATSISHGQIDAAVTLEGERRSVKGKDESGTKRRRRLVLSHELETKIKDLYEKFKEDDNCYQHISEALDPDGKVSHTQVLNKLKLLGVEVPRKKRRQTNTVPTFGQSHLAEGGNHDEMGDVSVGKSQHTRKRVHALNKYEEAEVKLLFEKFKNHRRCSYMIAKAMTGDRTFTAAQVTRQLKQLGLQKQNKSKVDMNMAEDYPGQQSEIEMQDSDDETLLSMRLKTKGKAKGMPDSELPSQFIHEELSNDSDEEFLSSALKKSRKRKSTVEIPNIGELPTTSTDKNLSVRIFEDLDFEDGLERDVQNPPFDAKTTVSPLNISRSTEAEEIDDFDSQISSQSRHSDNLLEDSDGGDPSYALARSALKGKGRVVLDLDDDDF